MAGVSTGTVENLKGLVFCVVVWTSSTFRLPIWVLKGSEAGWLAGWLVGWLVGRLAGWLLSGWLAAWLALREFQYVLHDFCCFV